MYELKLQFPPDFEERYNSYKEKLGAKSTSPKPTDPETHIKDDDLILVQTQYGQLTANPRTRDVKINQTQKDFSPESQEFKTLVKLMTGKNCTATYRDLLGQNITKLSKRTLTFIIRNIKEGLGILPARGAQNKDIIKNIPKHGYRLLIQS